MKRAICGWRPSEAGTSSNYLRESASTSGLQSDVAFLQSRRGILDAWKEEIQMGEVDEFLRETGKALNSQ